MAGIKVAAALSIAFLCLLFQCEIVQSHVAFYNVGDAKGWDLYPQVTDWPKTKHFKEGDVLVFKYKNPLYGVARVSATEYKLCQKNKGTKEYDSMNDRFILHKGSNYFISVMPEYCGYGMRIQVDAE